MSKSLTSFERQLCDIQGRLFELGRRNGLDCSSFIASFMNSETAAALDQSYDRLQWAGEEYILENLLEEMFLPKSTSPEYSNEVMFWAGYIYRYWHYLTNETSEEIYAQADAETMNDAYLGFHTLDVAMAIEDLKELHRQRTK